jgi:hypothetical protein
MVEVCRRRGPGRIVRDVLRWRVDAAGVMMTIDLADVFAGLP